MLFPKTLFLQYTTTGNDMKNYLPDDISNSTSVHQKKSESEDIRMSYNAEEFIERRCDHLCVEFCEIKKDGYEKLSLQNICIKPLEENLFCENVFKSACQQLLSDFWDTFPKTFFYVIW